MTPVVPPKLLWYFAGYSSGPYTHKAITMNIGCGQNTLYFAFSGEGGGGGGEGGGALSMNNFIC